MLEAFSLSDMGCVRTNNEDYCFIDAERGLYVLADGMGGAKAGEQASRIAVETVAETVRLSAQRDSQVLIFAVEEANRRVLEAAHNDSSLEGMGTTLVAALALDEELAIASVGDSRAYMLDYLGLHVITDDQTWVNEVGRPLGLDEESLRHHPMRHVLTMAIGASAPLTINHYRVPLAKGNLVLICSDGLHGVLEAPRMEQILNGGRSGGSLEESCRNLIEAAKQAGGPDNGTVVALGKRREKMDNSLARTALLLLKGALYPKSVGLAALGLLWAATALAQVAILQIRVIEGEGAVHQPGSRSTRICRMATW